MQYHDAPDDAVSPVLSAYRVPILLGIASIGMGVLAALQWPSSEPPRALFDEGAVKVPSSVSARSGAAVPPAKPSSATHDAARHDAAVATLPAMPSLPKEPDNAQKMRVPVEEILVVHPPAAGPAKTPVSAERLRAPPTQHRPRSAEAHECTPQVDALGLCEPGANVIR